MVFHRFHFPIAVDYPNFCVGSQSGIVSSNKSVCFPETKCLEPNLYARYIARQRQVFTLSRMRNSNSLGVVGQVRILYRLPTAISFEGTTRSLALVFCLLCASYGATRSSRGEHMSSLLIRVRFII